MRFLRKAENSLMGKNWGLIPSPNIALSFTHNLQDDYKHHLSTIYRLVSLQDADFQLTVEDMNANRHPVPSQKPLQLQRNIINLEET